MCLVEHARGLSEEIALGKNRYGNPMSSSALNRELAASLRNEENAIASLALRCDQRAFSQ